MEKDYVFMTIEETITKLQELPRGTSLDFTFNTAEDDGDNFEPCGWYGVKFMRIFDEPFGVLCIGYYGGLETEIINIEEEGDELVLFQKFCNNMCGWNVEQICVSKKYNGK